MVVGGGRGDRAPNGACFLSEPLIWSWASALSIPYPYSVRESLTGCGLVTAIYARGREKTRCGKTDPDKTVCEAAGSARGRTCLGMRSYVHGGRADGRTDVPNRERLVAGWRAGCPQRKGGLGFGAFAPWRTCPVGHLVCHWVRVIRTKKGGGEVGLAPTRPYGRALSMLSGVLRLARILAARALRHTWPKYILFEGGLGPQTRSPSAPRLFLVHGSDGLVVFALYLYL